MKREERDRKAAEWLEHLQSWKESGQSLAAYARGHGLTAWSAYQWRRALRRDGSFREEPGAQRRLRARRDDSPRIPLRFARVALASAPPTAPMIVRIQLANARRVEIEFGADHQLGELLTLLERPA